jgi:hypothetical protein
LAFEAEPEEAADGRRVPRVLARQLDQVEERLPADQPTFPGIDLAKRHFPPKAFRINFTIKFLIIINPKTTYKKFV